MKRVGLSGGKPDGPMVDEGNAKVVPEYVTKSNLGFWVLAVETLSR